MGPEVGSHRGAMFGRGCYFAEMSSKADEYSGSGDGIYVGVSAFSLLSFCLTGCCFVGIVHLFSYSPLQVFALLLCRVACGEIFRVTDAAAAPRQEALRSGRYDSVLADREAPAGGNGRGHSGTGTGRALCEGGATAAWRGRGKGSGSISAGLWTSLLGSSTRRMYTCSWSSRTSQFRL